MAAKLDLFAVCQSVRLSLLEYWIAACCILNQTGQVILQDGGGGGAMKKMTPAVETVYLDKPVCLEEDGRRRKSRLR
jgi:hypothetical protein